MRWLFCQAMSFWSCIMNLRWREFCLRENAMAQVAVSEILNPIIESDTPRHNPSRKAIGRLRSSKTGENT